MKFKLSAVASLVCLLLLVPMLAFAQPPALPHMFYGSLSIGGQAAPLGTVVEVRGANVTTGITGNPISTTVVGQYGSVSEPRLYVQGPNIENGDTIEFYVNGAKASETYQFQSSAITELNLTIASAPPPLPASFVVADLTVSPAQVESGETVTIEAEVTNSGGSAGDYTATLKINDAIVDSISLTLDPGEDQIVSFSIAKETAGTYTVQLAGLEGTFIITEPTEPVPPEAPATPPTSEPEPTLTPEPEPTPTSEPEPTPTSEPEPTLTPEPEPTPPGVNWAVLGPVLGVAVFLAVFLPIRLRRRESG